MPSPPTSTAKDVEEEVDQIHCKSIADLRRRYRMLFGALPPRAFGPDLLRRSITHKLQLGLYGDMPRWVRSELDQRIKSSEKNSPGRIALPRRIKPGSILVREWKTKIHRVTVLDSGFSWEDRRYDTLSEIAREITGTRWNGPRFFGLRAGTPSQVSSSSAQPR